mmetsp:Transcript_34167/g.74881  ORF Transcript_34167/g.74881 Transcript_34167/m.74881 type:complete len:216 (-) Transcript_34167:72-719(-)
MSLIIASLFALWSLLLTGPCCAFIVTQHRHHVHASLDTSTRTSTSVTRATSTSNGEGIVEDDQQLSSAGVARIATGGSADTSVRRDILLRSSGFAAAAAAAVSFGDIASPKRAFAATDGSAFVATYSDPKHPGGTRTVKLLDAKVGDYQLAEVQGGGGVGEPKSYVLPAAVLGDRTIIIDFSAPPKGGPPDFVGTLEKDGSIRFLRDGNVWPRVK